MIISSLTTSLYITNYKVTTSEHTVSESVFGYGRAEQSVTGSIKSHFADREMETTGLQNKE